MSWHDRHHERHFVDRAAWLRAAVLGANDGILSVSSLVVGVAAAAAPRHDILVAGAAGLVAGAMSMASGEYVSVSSQADSEAADLSRERAELAADHEHEQQELAGIYVKRGLEKELAWEVARQLMAKDALEAHARDELGIHTVGRARPVEAALTSLVTFSLGGTLPLLLVLVFPAGALVPAVSLGSLVCLAALGAFGASAGGAGLLRGAARVTLWGALAMALTAAIGRLAGRAF